MITRNEDEWYDKDPRDIVIFGLPTYTRYYLYIVSRAVQLRQSNGVCGRYALLGVNEEWVGEDANVDVNNSRDVENSLWNKGQTGCQALCEEDVWNSATVAGAEGGSDKVLEAHCE